MMAEYTTWRRGGHRDTSQWARGRGAWRRHMRDDDEEEPVQDDDSNFRIKPRRAYEGVAPSLEVPQVLGFYSVDKDKNIHFDNSMLPLLDKRYIPKDKSMEVDLDLNRGWHRANAYTISLKESYKSLLQWVLKNQKKLTAPGCCNKLAGDFVTYRGILKKIMLTTYRPLPYHDWAALALYYKGTIYLTYDYEEEEEATKEKEKSTLIDIYGHKFEQYLTGGDVDGTLESNCQFRCVLKLQLGQMSLLYAPDTDGADPESFDVDFEDLSSFVTLKMRKEQFGKVMLSRFKKYTTHEWWVQNKLAGIPRLVLGTRNEDGVVYKLQMLSTDDLEMIGQDWDPSVSINFLASFLKYVKEVVEAEPSFVHRFEKTSEDRYYVHHSLHPFAGDFLPNWYTEGLFAQEKKQ